jgi:ABC-type sulfate transport system permease component
MPIAILAALESDLGASLALASIMLLMALAVLLLVRWVTGKDDTDA